MEELNITNERVISFFKKNLSLKQMNENIIINTADFTSEDALFILEDFMKEFSVNKGYLDIDKYFQPTYPYGIGVYALIKVFLSIFGLVKKPIIEAKPPITISHMIEVAKRKEWFEPE